MSTATLRRGLTKDVLGRVTPPEHPFAHEREIYLHVEQQPKWAALLTAPMANLQQILTVTLMTVAGVSIGVALAHLLPEELEWIAWVAGIFVAIAIFWYLEITRPNKREAALAREALRLAGTPASKLLFTNGMHGDFSPKGAVATSTGSAMGFDPKHQLIRSVFVDPFKGRIWLDWVFGLDTLGELIIADLPRRTMANTLRRLFRRPLRMQPMIAFKDQNGNVQKLSGISPAHLNHARRLVREMNFHRPKEKALTL